MEATQLARSITYKILVDDPEDHNGLDIRGSVQPPRRDEQTYAMTLAGVLQYVADKANPHILGVRIETTTDDVAIYRDVQLFLTVPQTAVTIRRGIFIMLAQYLMFALVHDGDDVTTDVATIFHLFSGSGHNVLDALRMFKDPVDEMNSKVKDENHAIKRVWAGLEMHIVALEQTPTSETERAAKQFLTDNTTMLHYALERMKLSQGYLQVYVRDKPNVTPSATKLYKNYFNVEPSGGDYPIAIERNDAKRRTLLTVYGKKCGYYSDVFTTGSTNVDVAQVLASDMSQLQEGSDIVLFGFGYSGSGKTYTLMGNDQVPGALAIALASFAGDSVNAYTRLKRIKLEEIFIESIYAKYNTTKTLDIIGKKKMLYGRATGSAVDETLLYYLTDSTTSKLDTKANMKSEKQNKRKLKLTGVSEVELSEGNAGEVVNAFIRKIADEVETYLKKRFRIRPTPNNMTSSRVHTYFKFKLEFEGEGNDKTSSNLTVIDMAGRESPEAILGEFGRSSMSATLAQIGYMPLPAQSKIIKNGVAEKKLPGLLSTYKDEGITDYKRKRGKEYVDVSDMTALIAVEPRVGDDDMAKTYEHLVKTGLYINGTNPLSGYKGEEDAYAPFRVYESVGTDEEMKRLYGINAPMFYTHAHVAATIFEGYYIGASLDQLLQYFYKKAKIAEPQTSQTVVAENKIVAITGDILDSLNTNNAKFIMLAHVRVDRPEGLKTTLEFAQALSASMQGDDNGTTVSK